MSRKNSVNEMILKKFGEMIQTFGIKQITIDMIAEKCGISKKTVYKYFSSKHELVDRIITDLLDELGQRFDEIDVTDSKPIDKMYDIFASMYQLLGSLSIPLLHDIKTGYPEINARIDEFRTSHKDLVRRTIKDGIESGDFNPDVNPHIATEMIMGSAEKVIHPEYIISNNLTVEQTISSFKSFIVNGLVIKGGGAL
ncbi:MAG TPA: TetR/AcrR family transcriptional regulator [Spirochaetota bacterium]|nr:TetR/AcrR family transcriptional regulator [Spirochaetota bacterium]HPJ34582.1 TetR/AcrR family transcriptional regulator [Spirochaetota bacterium]